MSEARQLLCGAAERDITPPMELMGGMRGLMGARFGGVHDALKARAIAFDNGADRAVMVQIDMDKDQAPDIVVPEISKRYHVPEENILYFGIHTHCAPVFSGRHEFETRNPSAYERTCTEQYEELVKTGIYEAVGEAFQKLEPAKIGCGRQDCYLNTSRIKDLYQFDENGQECGKMCVQAAAPDAPISHEVFVLQIRDLKDQPIAFLVNYPMHGTLMFQNHLAEDGTDLISGDIGGNTSRLLEERFPGAVAEWSSGAAGDINPMFGTYGKYIDPETNELTDYTLEGCGDTLLAYAAAEQFMAVMQAMEHTPYFSGDGRIIGKIDWSETPGYKMTPDPETGQPVQGNERDEKGFSIRMQMLRIGDVLLTGIGGELFNSYGEELKKLSPLKNTVIINHNCSLITDVGYILDDETIGRDYVFRPGKQTPIIPGYIRESLDKILLEFFSD